MRHDLMRGFTMLNTPGVLGVEWVHLPCLEQAFLRLVDLGSPGDGVGLELLCPRCWEVAELGAEDAEVELVEAERRHQLGERGGGGWASG